MSYSKKLEDWIDHFFIDRENLTKKKQMGGVGWLVNGNMVCGIYEELLVVRVHPDNMETVIEKPGIHRFGEDKVKTADFISITHDTYSMPEVRRSFLSHAFKYSRSLPPKDQSGQQGSP